MKNEREQLERVLKQHGSWFLSLEYVVVEELKKDYEELVKMIHDPNRESRELGGAILGIGLQIRRVQEKLDEVDGVYGSLLRAAPTMVEQAKR